MIKSKVTSISNRSEIKSFNYQQLNPKVRDEIQELTVDIKSRLRRCAQDIYVIGRNLCQIKQQLKHGEFRIWLKSEFDWSVSAANKFMHVSQRFHLDDLEEVEISPSALYMLAAPSTPQEVRTQALTKAKQGQTITFSFAKQLLKKNYNKQSQEKFKEEQKDDVIIEEYHQTTVNQLLIDRSSFLDFIKVDEKQLNLSVAIYDSFDFNDYLQQEWQRMFRAEQYFSLVICQIDIQDSSCLNPLMPQLIQQVSYGLAYSLKRTGDFVGKYNKNQCIAVLPNTNPEGTQFVLDRFLDWLTPWQKKLNQYDSLKTLKISLGTSSVIPKRGMTVHSLIKTALPNKH